MPFSDVFFSLCKLFFNEEDILAYFVTMKINLVYFYVKGHNFLMHFKFTIHSAFVILFFLCHWNLCPLFVRLFYLNWCPLFAVDAYFHYRMLPIKFRQLEKIQRQIKKYFLSFIKHVSFCNQIY